MRQKGFLIFILLIILMVAGYFRYKFLSSGSSPRGCTTEARICPDGSAVGRSGPKCEFEACPTSKPSSAPTVIEKGTVSGRLCYPSSFLPPGEIVAKDLDSGKTYTQDYVGSMAGGKLTYTFELPAGIYHLKYQAHASTKDTSIFTSGYFDECAKTMHTDQCTPDSGHINIGVEVVSKEEIQNVDLCDFYYNPTQEQSLNQNF